MAQVTGIEWTDATWNPTRGCTRVSEGCRNCYAETVARRFAGPGQPYEGLVRIGGDGQPLAQWNGQLRFVERALLVPLSWRGKPVYDASGKRVGFDRLRIFVNSMSDLFHEGVTDEMLDRVFGVMALCPEHDFQVLTKRPARMLAYLHASRMKSDIYLRHVHFGVSVENQETADERIQLLLRTPAAVRFISYEPALGPVDLSLRGIDWVICGGESGKGARPMDVNWARGVRDQCAAAGVPFFFKQWGEWLGTEITASPPSGDEDDNGRGVIVNGTHGIPIRAFADGKMMVWNEGHPRKALASDPMRAGMRMSFRVGKKEAGSLLDGVEHKAFPVVR